MAKKPLSAQPASTSWNRLIVVCTTCEDGESDLAARLKKRLKQGDLRGIRAVRSSCLDVCPEQGVCCSLLGDGPPRTFVVDMNTDVDALLNLLQATKQQGIEIASSLAEPTKK